MDINDRLQGCLVGLACGDAVGTTLEFRKRGSFTPISDMVGGGPFNLLPGQWTDDTSMALCLAHSLLLKKEFDPIDQMNRYCDWYHHGYMSSTGTCFDIGGTVRQALDNYLQTQYPFSGAVDDRSSGNGSLMRIAPIAIFYHKQPELLLKFAGESSRTTHGSSECIDSCRYFVSLLAAAFTATDKAQLLATPYTAICKKVLDITQGNYLSKAYEELTGSGYVIESLESALWCFHHSHSFAEAILLASNIGNDADTTAAICGQLAGAFYGYHAIPEHWRKRLFECDEIAAVALQLAEV
ncbi:MAG TPA: ADP-ribosylglycohydrolase family protein [Cellvibrio sp.]|nr:ADP-ribosylglycohydrolase family protein [Cellvibrio sp.]